MKYLRRVLKSLSVDFWLVIGLLILFALVLLLNHPDVTERPATRCKHGITEPHTPLCKPNHPWE